MDLHAWRMPHREVLASALEAADDVVQLARSVGAIPEVRADHDAATAAHAALQRAARASFRAKDALRAAREGHCSNLGAVSETIGAIADAARELQALVARLPSE
jgi:hypothetical protein